MPMVRCRNLVFRTEHVSAVELDCPVQDDATRPAEHGAALSIHNKRFVFAGREAQALRAWALANCTIDLGYLADVLDETPGADAGAVAPGPGLGDDPGMESVVTRMPRGSH